MPTTQDTPSSGEILRALQEEIEELRHQLAQAHGTIRRLLNVSEPSEGGKVSIRAPLVGAERTILEILSRTPVVVFLNDPTLRYTWLFNPHDPAGGETTEFIGKSDRDIFSDEIAEQLTALKRDVIRSGEGTRRELTIRTPDGDRVYDLTLGPVRDQSGTVTGISGTVMDVTERRLADREIRLLAQTVASTRDAVLIADIEGRLLFVNDSFQQMFGYTDEEAFGQDISIGGAPAPGTPLRDQIAGARLAAGWHGESVGVQKNGTTFPLDVWTSLLRNDENKPVAIVEVARDLSAVKQAERIQMATYRIAAAVSTTENMFALYRAIHEIVGEMMPARNLYIAVLDENANVISFPYFVDEVDPPPAPRAPAKGLTEYVIRSGQPLLASPEVFGDLLMRGAVESLGAPSLDWLGVPLVAGGKAIGAIVVQSYSEGVRFNQEHTEILTFVSTQIAMAIERKRAEGALRESEARLQTVFESLPFDLWVCDADGRYLMQNPASVNHWGNQIGKYPSETKLGQDVIRRWEQNNRRALAGELVTGEQQYGEGDGIVHVYNIITPIRRDGEILGILGINIDVTERKNLQMQLLQAQKLESIGTLAGGIAHDFNNILGIIMGHAALLPDAARDAARLSRSVTAIQKAGKRGAALVRQILTFARKANIVFESVNINDVVAELGRMLHETFPRSIAFTLDLHPGLPPIEADRTQIHQTLLNLCVNARDAMPDGGTLAISTRLPLPQETAGHSAGQYVCVTVADTGTGMDETTQRRIFEPFYTTKDLGKGTGLGLSVVYGIMQSHRGFVTVESSLGKGTRFRLYFPAPAAATADEAVIAERTPASRGGTETLLLVEDEEMLSELVKTSLEAAGYTVLAATDGEQALSIYESLADDIALVITDLGLPRMGGRELFLRLRALRRDVRVIIATGYIDSDERVELMQLGAFGFLQKPYLPDDVARSVREALHRADHQ